MRSSGCIDAGQQGGSAVKNISIRPTERWRQVALHVVIFAASYLESTVGNSLFFIVASVVEKVVG